MSFEVPASSRRQSSSAPPTGASFVDCVLPWPRREPSLRRRWSMTLFDREGRHIEIDRGHSAIHKTRADTAYLRVMTDVPRQGWTGPERSPAPSAVVRRANFATDVHPRIGLESRFCSQCL